MQMGCVFVHMYHRRNNVVPADLPAQKVGCPFKIGFDFLPALAFEKRRAGGDEGVHKPGAVLPGTAFCRRYPSVNLLPIAALRLDDVEVMFAFACVNVGVTGVLFLFSLVMGLQRPGRSAFVLRKP